MQHAKRNNNHTKQYRQLRATTRYNGSSLQCIIFIPVLVFDFWFVQSPWFPVQTQELVKGDTLLSICIAGEKRWTLATLHLRSLSWHSTN